MVLHKYLNGLYDIANKQFLEFYSKVYDKQPTKSVKLFGKQGLNIIAGVSSLNNNDNFVIFNPSALQQLFFILADDIKTTGSGIILEPDKKLTKIAEYYSILLENRFKKLSDVYYLALPNNFIDVFGDNTKLQVGLSNNFINFSGLIISYMQQIAFNLANLMSILGKFNPKYWDDSIMEIYSYTFVLLAYLLTAKFILSQKNIQCSMWFSNEYLMQCSSLNSFENLQDLNVTIKEFRKTMIYDKLQEFINILQDIYEKNRQKYGLSTVKF